MATKAELARRAAGLKKAKQNLEKATATATQQTAERKSFAAQVVADREALFDPATDKSGVIPVPAGATQPVNPSTGPTKRVYTASDGQTFTDQLAYATYEAALMATKDAGLARQRTASEALAQTAADKVSGYDLLYSELDKLGLGDLVSTIKDTIINSDSKSERIIKLRASESYQNRFAGMKDRIKNGFNAIDEATYLELEDRYTSIMQNYGLPSNYYARDNNRANQNFNLAIANNIDPVTFEERIILGQDRVLKSNPEVLQAIKQFFPEITDGDILAYTINPKNALEDIKRKVSTAEVGGAALQAGLKTSAARAGELVAGGVDKKTAQGVSQQIAGGLERGSQLASIYNEDPYTQTGAENELYGLAGATEAGKKRKKITGLEQASFGGQSGITSSALSRDRAGAY